MVQGSATGAVVPFRSGGFDDRTASRTMILCSTRHLCLSFSDHQKLCATPGCWKEQNGIKSRSIWRVDGCGRTGTHCGQQELRERQAHARSWRWSTATVAHCVGVCCRNLRDSVRRALNGALRIGL